jgi:hypothetical protein
MISACSSTKETGSTRAETRKAKKQAEIADVKKAVEGRRYIIKVDRIFPMGGRSVQMVPRSNFVAVNGEIATISLGYIGRSFGIHPISGINFNGHTLNYKMESNEDKGLYNIEMVVSYGSDKFNVYLTIGNEGTCNISINNPYIESVSYTGNLVPLKEVKDAAPKGGEGDTGNVNMN